MLNSIQFVFPALNADPAALFAVCPGQMFIRSLQNQLRHLHRLVVFIQSDHHKMGVVDMHPVAVGRFYVGVYADLHGSVAHPGELAFDNHHIILVSAFEKSQIVHRSGGNITHAVPLGHNAGHLVDPLHQNAAKEAMEKAYAPYSRCKVGAALLCADGTVYQGQFEYGRRHGEGTMSYINGERYEGVWNKDVRSGRGTYYYADGRRYEGSFEKDVVQGFGALYYTNGDIYTGLWENGERHGTGVYIWGCDGSNYNGEWYRDRKQGKGRLFWLDGASYDGYWKDDVRDGEGTFFYSNGDEYTGLWSNNVQHGKGEYRFADGEFQVVEEQMAISVTDLIEKLNTYEEKVTFLGDGVPVYCEQLKAGLTGEFAFAPAHLNRQRAGAVGALGMKYFQEGKIETAMEHRPDYLRLSQAERERAEKNASLS